MIQVTTTDTEHCFEGYWDYDMLIQVDEHEYKISCWKLATFLARGASQDIDGSGLENWGDSQPGGWRSLDFDSQCLGKPQVKESSEGCVTVSNANNEVEIAVPKGHCPEEFMTDLQQEIDQAAAGADPEEPDAEAVWNDLCSYNEMGHYPVRIGRVFGSAEVFVAWEDGEALDFERAGKEGPSEELRQTIVRQFKAEFKQAVERTEED